MKICGNTEIEYHMLQRKKKKMNYEEQNIANQEQIILLLEEIRDLLETTASFSSPKKNYNQKYAKRSPLTDEDKEILDQEIDFDWWLASFGEEPRPAKDMNRQGLPYSPEEKKYLYRRLVEIASVGGGTDDGLYVLVDKGKIWCPAEKNAANCFALELRNKGTRCNCQFGNCTLCIEQWKNDYNDPE